MAQGALLLTFPQSRIVFLAAASMTLAALSLAQAYSPVSTAAASTKLPAYDIVSVKPHKSSSGGGVRIAPDGEYIEGTTVSNLIMNAYELTMPSQISDLPAWADSDEFDIEAKMDEYTTAAIQKLPQDERWREQDLMMQALLADRFQLKVHHETRELPVYDLVIAKGGPKMKAAPADLHSGWSMGNGRFEGKSVPIDSLVYGLSNTVGRVVTNKTGLTGNYGITLKWTPDGQQETADSGPSIFAALEEQLGLRLVAAKGPVDTIVVDHLEKPSPN